MDKMGESAKAGNKGVPATPRDGADVEIVGLLKSNLRWVIELNAAGKFPWVCVEAEVDGAKKEVSFKDWDALVQKSFEKYFYIPKDKAEYPKYTVNPDLVSRPGSYKDVYKCSKEYSDYELRPNFPVAMVVAPELFHPEHALGALQLVYDKLAGPLGMRTLDPDDWAYRPNYDNSNDGEEKAIAKGWNYHQGPEWLWCTGYFLRAYLHFDIEVNCNSKKANAKLLPDAMLHIHRLLLAHKKEIPKNQWAGLPELTNKDGAVCWDGCPTQAWSASTLLDLLENMVQRYNVHVKRT
jgi:glycogen debranching enzyme